MPGLYIHIPFCSRRCPYCDFAVSVDSREDFRARYLNALLRELTRALTPAPGPDNTPPPLATVFVGGGTPTELPAAWLGQILSHVQGLATTAAPDGGPAEISLECNPEHLDAPYLRALAHSGFNRISLGAQSFDGAVLEYLGRKHSPQTIETVVRLAREAGFDNISLDLIYAVPGQTLSSWEDTLHRAVSLGVPHVSAYSLTVESGTEFGRRARLGQLIPLQDDAQADYMAAASSILEAAGLQRYEVSNYARPGYTSRHNQNYWRGGDYLAAGAGAHGHQNGHRFWNERSTTRYVRRMETEGTAVCGEEHLSPLERLEESVAMGLRCTEGFDMEELSRTLQLDARQQLGEALLHAQQRGWLSIRRHRVNPDPDFLAVADSVARHLLT